MRNNGCLAVPKLPHQYRRGLDMESAAMLSWRLLSLRVAYPLCGVTYRQ